MTPHTALHGPSRAFVRRCTRQALAALALAAAAPWVTAAPITLNLDVTFGNFVELISNTQSAFAPITGSFTITFDPGSNVASTSSGLTVHSMSYAPASPWEFAYDALSKQLSIGGSQYGAGVVGVGTTDIALQFLLDDPLLPTLGNCGAGYACGPADGNSGVLSSAFTQGGQNAIWFAQTGSVVNVEAVPEPASVALVGAALLGLFASRRRRPVAPA